MIGQNRQAKVAEVKASHDFTGKSTTQDDTQLPNLIHDLAMGIHAITLFDRDHRLFP